MSDALLANYHQLLERVDALCRSIEAECSGQIVCHRGCDACCRHLRLFPVEAAALAEALHETSPSLRAQLQAAAAGRSESDPCPLLTDGACQLYAARPIICRTHGLPLLTGVDGSRKVDFCPLNFTGVERLPAAMVIDLDRLNTALAAVNRLYVHECGGDDAAAALRRTIAEILQDVDVRG